MSIARPGYVEGWVGAPKQGRHMLQGVIVLSCLLSLSSVICFAASSDAVLVSVSETEFYAYGSINIPGEDYGNISTNYSVSLASSSPVQVSLWESYGIEALPDLHLSANSASGWFTASVETFETLQYGHASASAVSDMTFSPLSNQTTSVSIDVGIFHEASTFSEGFVSLVDLTADTPLWYYEWFFGGYTNLVGAAAVDRLEPYLTYDYYTEIPKGSSFPPAQTFTQETEFVQGHAYELVTYAYAGANGDWELVTLEVSGIDIIPEPTTFTLLSLGSLALVMVRRRR